MVIDTPTNYTGAIVFWAYIAGALFLTTVIARSILNSHQQHGRQNIPPFLIILALLSFSTLSYHMLNVLILSYNQWTAEHNATSSLDHLHIWQWSITSSLFQDFGEAIVATKQRYLLSSLGLLTTIRVASYMGIEGRRQKVPNLWAFFALLEILPTSFAQTLFYMILCTRPQTTQSRSKLKYWPAWVLSSLAYILCLNIAPNYTGPQLIYIILFARLLLLLPLFLPLQQATPPQRAGMSPDTPGTLYLFQFTTASTSFFNHVKTMKWDVGVVPILLEALQSHPAVRTLGYDFVYSMAGFGYWTSREGKVQKEMKRRVQGERENDAPVTIVKAAKNRRDKRRN